MFFAAFALLLLASCSDGQKPAAQKVANNGTDMILSANDTAAVQMLVTDFLELVTTDRVEEALRQLYVLDGDELKPLPDDQKEGFRQTWNAFDIKGYAIKSFFFHSETDTEVHYSLYLKDPATTSNPPAINGLIQPVRRNGTWYITLANVQGEQMQRQKENQ
jgi:hypothetical protein